MIDRRLHVLRVLASQGTVTAAAAVLGYTPSAVSHQLRGLSHDLGVTLLEQDGRGVRLTSAARVLLGRTDELYAQWEEIRGELLAVEDERAGTLRLCGFSTAAAALLPDLAVYISERYPRCAVHIIEADPEACFDLLVADKADVGVVVATPSLPPRSDPRFDQQPLLDDPLDLLVSADNPLAAQDSILLSDAANEPWILDRPSRAHRQLVLTACAAAGFSPTEAHQSAEWDTGAAIVAAGLGVALVPRLARIPEDYRIARVPLRGDPSPARHVLTVVRRGSHKQPLIADALKALGDIAERSVVDS